MMEYKKILRMLTIVFIGFVLLLTFFSQTLADLFIPRVSLTFANSGTISPEAMSFGVVTQGDEGFFVEAAFPSHFEFITIGRNAAINAGDVQAAGRIVQVEHRGGQNAALIEINDSGFEGGEFAFITVSEGIFNATHVVPLSAVREEQHGFFVLYIEAVPRLFGYNYFVRRIFVDVDRRDVWNAAVSPRFGQGEIVNPVVVNSDTPVYVGARVRFAGGNP